MRRVALWVVDRLDRLVAESAEVACASLNRLAIRLMEER